MADRGESSSSSDPFKKLLENERKRARAEFESVQKEFESKQKEFKSKQNNLELLENFQQKFDSCLEELNKCKQENKKLIDKMEEIKHEKSENEKNFKEDFENLLSERKICKDQINTLQNELINLTKNMERLQLQNTEESEKLIQKTNQLDELKRIMKITSCFICQPNKIVSITENEKYSCCDNKCINRNISNGLCNSGNGYINVNDAGKVKYFISEGINNTIPFYGKEFIKQEKRKDLYSLYYFEAKFTRERDQGLGASIGIYLEGQIYPKLAWDLGLTKHDFIDGDVFGCGLVMTPSDKKDKIPFIFFTKNGEKLKDEDIQIKDKFERLSPLISLWCCSAEVNFGNDIIMKPFIYDLTTIDLLMKNMDLI